MILTKTTDQGNIISILLCHMLYSGETCLYCTASDISVPVSPIICRISGLPCVCITDAIQVEIQHSCLLQQSCGKYSNHMCLFKTYPKTECHSFSPTRPSGPSWSSSRHVRLFLCWMSPSHAIFLHGRTGADRAWSVDWCDLNLE